MWEKCVGGAAGDAPGTFNPQRLDPPNKPLECHDRMTPGARENLAAVCASLFDCDVVASTQTFNVVSTKVVNIDN